MEAFLQTTGKRIETGGFVLLEVLPALMILMLALLGAMRLAWTAMEHSRSAATASWREQVLPVVWEAWARENSRVVVALETGDGLDIQHFPSAAWIPPLLDKATDTHQLILRRDSVEFGGRPAWRISRRVTASGNNDGWQALLVVFQAQDLEEERAR